MLQDFIIPFILVFIAELGDKTQLAVILLTSRTKKHFQLFAGILLAFLLANGLAILLGAFFKTLIPEFFLRIGSAVIFIVFGGLILMNNETSEKFKIKSAFITGFLIIFVAEMGDKSQIATALFATKYNPLIVFISVMLALTTITILAMFIGKFVKRCVSSKFLTLISGFFFIAIGVFFLSF